MQIPTHRLRAVLAMPLLLAPLVLASCSSPTPLGGKLQSSQDEANVENNPATADDIFLYRGIGSSFICNARSAGVEFPTAVGVSAATYAQVLSGHHGGYVASAGNKKLTNKQLFSGAEFQVVTGALQYCPEHVPDDVKAKVEAAIEKQKNKPGKN